MKRKTKTSNSAYDFQDTLFQPISDWAPATSFPDLSGERMLGIDTETRDPQISTRGPGFIRGDAKVVGFSIATRSRAWYFPFDHLSGGNLRREDCIAFAKTILSDENRCIVGANLQYELEGFEAGLGIKNKCKVIDIQIAEALIDEEADSYKLESLCKKYLGTGKDETLLREAAEAYGVDPKSGMWKLHSKYVGPYAEFDALAPMQIFEKQLEILKAEETLGVFQLEMELLPLLWEMRKQGIPMDMQAADDLSALLKKQEDVLRLRLRHEFNTDCNEMSSPDIANVCNTLGILYPRTTLGAPSFTADYLDASEHPFLVLISDLRECSGMRNKFVDGWIHRNQISGRIHPQWKQCASDDGGTRTGRMAASNPNPQQVPASSYRKTGEINPIGSAIRKCFGSDTGLTGKLDYSQQEPKVLVHFANLCKYIGAPQAAAAYQANPNLDFYNYMMEAAGIGRRPAKDMYLGRCYGMGANKMAAKLNKTKEEAAAILAVFDERVPFVKELADGCNRAANDRGYIKTLLGRRRHFNFWEPIKMWDMKKQGLDVRARRLDAAQALWGKNIRRSDTHKALNALIQGSSADMTKAALIKIWKEGKVIPYMQVHDEIVFPANDEAHAKLCKKLAETCVTMTVPVRADLSLGKTWK